MKKIVSYKEIVLQETIDLDKDGKIEFTLPTPAEIDYGKVSDGYHTFDELYYHRMILFSIICNQNKKNSWKSKLHNDGTMFEGYFIVGVFTGEGQYTYHYKLDYWDLFEVDVLEKAPEWDGHRPEDIGRLLNLI